MTTTSGTAEIGNVADALGATGAGSITVTFQNGGPNAPATVASALIQQSADGVTGWNPVGTVTASSTAGGSVSQAFNISLPGAAFLQVNFSNLDSTVTNVYTSVSASAAPPPPVQLPGAPTSLTATAETETSISVSYAAPTTGGTPFTGYVVQHSPAGANAWTVDAANNSTLTFTIPNLTPGTAYDIQVAAINSAGTGAFATLSAISTQALPPPPVFPSAPTVTAGTPTSTTVPLSWTVPTTGGPILSYNVQRSPAGANTWATVASGLTTTTYVDTALTPSTSYDYQVQGVNSNGLGAWGQALGVKTAAATLPAGQGYDFRASVKGPAGFVGDPTGCLPVIPSTQYSAAQGYGWEAFTPTAIDESGTVDPRLAGINYRTNANVSNFRVDLPQAGAYAISLAIGAVQQSQRQYTAIYDDTTLLATILNGVTNTVGSFYDATGKQYTAAQWPSSNSPVTLTFSSTILRVQIGTTIAGQSGSSSYISHLFVQPTTTGVTLPSAPTNMAVSATGQTTLSASWNAPVTGSPFNGFDVDYALAGSGNWVNSVTSAAASPVTISGLTAGTSYDVRVRADNAGGAGAYAYVYATSTQAVPVVAPGAPGAITFTGETDTTVSLTWVAPTTGGPVDTYTIQYSTDGAVGKVYATGGTSKTNSFTVSGLTQNTAYLFRVSATNAAGTSAYGPFQGTFTTKTPVSGVPTVPTNVSVSATGQTTLSVAFGAPTSGSPFTGYNVQHSPAGANAWTSDASGVALTASPVTISGLAAGTAYDVRVQATNATGAGAWATVYGTSTLAAQPTAAPSVPTGVTATEASSSSANVGWSLSTGQGTITYNIQRSTDQATWTTVATNVSGTSFTDTGLTLATAYFYQVASTNSFGPSAWSTSASVTLVAISFAQAGMDATVSHPADVPVAWLVNASDNTMLTNLVYTSVNDGASNAKYKADQFGNICTAGFSNLTAGTDTVTVSGTCDQGSFNNFPLSIVVHPDDVNLRPQGLVMVAPLGGTIDQARHIITVDVTNGLQSAGTPLCQLFVVGDASFTAPVWSGPFPAAADVASSKAFTVDAAGVVYAAAPWATPPGGGGNPCFFATQNGITYHNAVQIKPLNNVPLTTYPPKLLGQFVTSTFAKPDRTSIVAQILMGTNNEFMMLDDQDQRFSVMGYLGLIGALDIYVTGALSPGTYSPIVRVMGQYQQAPKTATGATNPLVGLQDIPLSTVVLDATPTAGCVITPNIAANIDNCVNIGTVVLSPTVTGLNPATTTWCIHQDPALRLSINNTTGVCTSRIPLSWGDWEVTLVASDGAGHNAVLTFTLSIPWRTTAPVCTIQAGIAQVSGVSYPDLITFFKDVNNSTGNGNHISCPLAGATALIVKHPSGTWIDQTPFLTGGENYIHTPIKIIGDLSDGSDMIDIKMFDPLAMSSKAWCDPVDVDFWLENIRFGGMHNNFNSACIIPDGGGKQRIKVRNCVLYDCDDTMRGGTLGGVLELEKVRLEGSSVDNQAHNIYIADYAYMSLRDVYSKRVLVAGHAIKSRTRKVVISNTFMADCNLGSASTALDICNGGYYALANSLVHNGPNCQNQNAINWSSENQAATVQQEVLMMHNVKMINDSIDWRPPIQVSAYTSTTKGLQPIIIQRNVTAYGVPNSRPLDQSSDTTQQFLVGLDVNPNFITDPMQRPSLVWPDPTSCSPSWVPPKAFHAQAGNHDQGSTVTQTIGGIGVDIIEVSASALADQEEICQFTLDVYEGYSWDAVTTANIAGTFTAGDTLSLTFQSTQLNGNVPITVTTTPMTATQTMAFAAVALAHAVDGNPILHAAKIWCGFQNQSYVPIKAPNLMPLKVTPSVQGAGTETLIMDNTATPYSTAYGKFHPPIVTPTFTITNFIAGNGVSNKGNITGLSIDPASGILRRSVANGALVTGPRQIVVAVNGPSYPDPVTGAAITGQQKYKTFTIMVHP